MGALAIALRFSFAQGASSASAAVPAAVLWSDLLPLAFGIFAVLGGLLGLLFLAGQKAGRKPLLLLFCVIAVLYGARLIAGTATASFLLPAGLLTSVDRFVTGTILLPFTLFAVDLLRPGWRRYEKWIAIALSVQAVAFLAASWSGRYFPLANTVNSVLVLGGIALMCFLALTERSLRPRERRVLRAGLFLFFAFVVYTNLFTLGVLHGTGRVEYIGFAALLLALGYVTVQSAAGQQAQLRSLNAELETAQRIQRGLLPDVAGIARVQVAARYQPVASVAGDFYDLLRSDSEGFGVLIADVAGHGIPAALTASMVKVALRAQQSRAADPAAVLTGVNQVLCGSAGAQLVTAAYLYFDYAAGEARYCAAGHPAMLLQAAPGQAPRWVEANGLLLGAFPSAPFQNWTAPLLPGSRWLLYTDGVLEAANVAGEEWGAERLRTEFARADDAPEATCGRVLRHVLQWGREQADDITLICLRYAG